MTPQQINTAIAEACGWRELEEISDHCGTYGWWGIPSNRDTEIPIPNYHGDLNAMHEAEGTLDINQQYNYGEEIRKITGNTGPRGGHFTPNGHGCFSMATATAAQRAEAFLRTIGKWEEVE